MFGACLYNVKRVSSLNGTMLFPSFQDVYPFTVRKTFNNEFFIFDVGSSMLSLVEPELLIMHFCRINFNSVASAMYDWIIEYTSHIANNMRMTVVKFIFTTILVIYCKIL